MTGVSQQSPQAPNKVSLPRFLDPESVHSAVQRVKKSPELIYLFRGHYVIGPRAKAVTKLWQSMQIAPSTVVSYDPTVNVTTTRTAYFLATLIGEVYDWQQPEHSNQQILDRWIRQARSIEEVIHSSDDLAGRWALYLYSGDTQLIIHDACGSFQVNYVCMTDSESWISSSPKLIAQQIGAPIDNVMVEQLLNPYCYARVSGQALPLDRTAYEGIRCLLPNHVLYVHDRSTRQYWPYKPLQLRSVESVAPSAAQMFSGIIQAMGLRKTLFIGTTAGTDSRMMVAAAHYSGAPFRSFTWSMTGVSNYKHMDVQTAHRLMHLLERDHYLIYSPDKFSVEMRAILDACITMPSSSAERAAMKYTHWPFQDHHVLIGGASEITRCFWHWEGSDVPTVGDIVGCCGFGNNRFAHTLYEPWLEHAKRIHHEFNLQVMDQLYWHMRVGRWLAENLTTLNLVQLTGTPFSCRSWFASLLEAVDYTPQRSVQLYKAMIEHLEPLLSDVPLNPFPLKHRLKKAARQSTRGIAKRIASLLGLRGFIKSLRQRPK